MIRKVLVIDEKIKKLIINNLKVNSTDFEEGVSNAIDEALEENLDLVEL